MALDNDTLAAASRNRAFAYRYAWRLLAAEPDAALLGTVAGEVAKEQVEALLGPDSRGAAAQRRLAALVSDEGLAPRLPGEYTRLFVGPAKPVAPLWESVFRDPDELLFQQSTLAVRQAYRSAGFKASAGPSQADDHLAIELDFMATLASESADAAEAGDIGRARLLMRHGSAFLANHLNLWLGPLEERLLRDIPESASDFYPLVITYTIELCKTDAAILEALLQASEDGPDPAAGDRG